MKYFSWFAYRMKPQGFLPDTPFGAAVVCHGRYYPPREARVIWLRLPVWGFEYCPQTGDYRWGQRVVVYHGWHGFRLYWQFDLGWAK